MKIDEAIEIFGQHANVIDYGVSQGIKKGDLVWLFDKFHKLNESPFNMEIVREVEELIVKVAEQSFDEKMNSVLFEIKQSISKSKNQKWTKNS